jgi:hypothetical protein
MLAEMLLASAFKLAAVPGDGGTEPGNLGDNAVGDPAGATEEQWPLAAGVLLLKLGISREERVLGSGEAGLQGVEDGEFG